MQSQVTKNLFAKARQIMRTFGSNSMKYRKAWTAACVSQTEDNLAPLRVRGLTRPYHQVDSNIPGHSFARSSR